MIRRARCSGASSHIGGRYYQITLWPHRVARSSPPFLFQIVISTGKSDWAHSVQDVEDSLAYYLAQVETAARPGLPTPDTSTPGTPQSSISELRDLDAPGPGPAALRRTASNLSRPFTPGLPSPVVGIFRDNETHKVSVLNGSHRSLCHRDECDTVLVFPDYKVVCDVRRDPSGARELWSQQVDPAVPRMGALEPSSTLRSWVIPYACVILICACASFSIFARHHRLTLHLAICRLAQTTRRALRCRRSQARERFLKRARTRGMGRAHSDGRPRSRGSSARGRG